LRIAYNAPGEMWYDFWCAKLCTRSKRRMELMTRKREVPDAATAVDDEERARVLARCYALILASAAKAEQEKVTGDGEA
jgi:hypothetical protein